MGWTADENGELFFINTVIGHLWHALPGAHLQRMFGDDLDPDVYALIPQVADHFHWDTREQWSDIRKLGVTPTTDEGGGHARLRTAAVSRRQLAEGVSRLARLRSISTGIGSNRDTLEREEGDLHPLTAPLTS